MFSVNQTSAGLMEAFARNNWLTADSSPDLQKRYVLLFDLYIKARSYALLNKTGFILTLLGVLSMLAWPVIAFIYHDVEAFFGFGESAAIQTAVSGLTAFGYALYSHYKKRQQQMENLMRRLCHSDQPYQQLVPQLLTDIERIDSGFAFAEHLPGAKKPAADADRSPPSSN
jgi:hypothetical protein